MGNFQMLPLNPSGSFYVASRWVSVSFWMEEPGETLLGILCRGSSVYPVRSFPPLTPRLPPGQERHISPGTGVGRFPGAPPG